MSLLAAAIAALSAGVIGGCAGAIGGFFASIELGERLECGSRVSESAADLAAIRTDELTVVQSCTSHFKEVSGWETTTHTTLFIGRIDEVERVMAAPWGGTRIKPGEALVGSAGIDLPVELVDGGMEQDWLVRDDGRWRRTLEWGRTTDDESALLLLTMAWEERAQRSP